MKSDSKRQKIARLCKLHIEYDRSMRAREQGYCTFQCKILRPELSPKNDLLFGFLGDGKGSDVEKELFSLQKCAV